MAHRVERVALTAALGMLLVGLVSCSSSADECVAGDARCDGTVASVCMTNADHQLRWFADDCGPSRFCVHAGHNAFCVVDSTPSPLCPPSLSEIDACDGATMIGCQEGYVVGRFPCKSCTPCTSTCGFSPVVCESGLGAKCSTDTDCLSGYICINSACALPCGSVPWCPVQYCSSSSVSGTLVPYCGTAITQ